MRAVLLTLHALLIAATGLAILEQVDAVLTRLLALAVCLLPLALALPGLAAGRHRTRQWLALLLVVYIGAAAVEVVATLGSARACAAVLLIALLELALLFALSRRPPPRSARE